jgi:hypothetical protein
MPILNKFITTALPLIPKSIVGQVAKRYIAGVKLSDGVSCRPKSESYKRRFHVVDFKIVGNV